MREPANTWANSSEALSASARTDASVERSAIDVPRRSLGVEYLAGQGKENLEKIDQENPGGGASFAF